MSDLYKHISEKAARKASDELARVKTEHSAAARAKLLQERATAADVGLIGSATMPTVTDAVSQSAVVH
jgi:hypothetical protein